MATVFPATPTVNQTYTTGGVTWKWTGVLWQLVANAANIAEHAHSYDGAVVSAN
jgi:hypothetical protein